MKITVLTLFTEMYEGFLNTSIIKRIIDKKLVEIKVCDIREYSLDKHRHVDDTPYGGGPGMLMKVDVVNRAIRNNKSLNTHILLTSPDSRPLVQKDFERLSKIDDLMIICGHYEGIDSRIEEYIDEKVSIGDYILTGGELPSMVIIDGILRLIDEGISSRSLLEESFNNNLLEYPQYTRPAVYENMNVPEVLMNGDHSKIQKYNLKMSLKKTILERPDLLKNRKFSKEEIALLEELADEFKR